MKPPTSRKPSTRSSSKPPSSKPPSQPELEHQPEPLLPIRAGLESILTPATSPALAAVARALADRMDALATFDTFDDKLAREYRLTLKAIAEDTAHHAADDREADIIVLRATVGDG